MKKSIKKNKREILKSKKFIIPLLIVLIFFMYKSFYLFSYHFSKDDNYDRLYFKDSIILKNNNTTSNYLQFNNIKIRNDFEKFILETKNAKSVKYNLINKFNKVQASLQIISDKTYIDKFREDDYNNSRYNSIDRNQIIKENHITNDIEFIKYLKKELTKKNNILTRVKDMKKRYALKYFTNKEIPQFDYLTLIDGDYTGYMFDNFNYSNNQFRQVVILKDNRSYIFRFYSCCYFDENYIKELLSTVVID